MSVLTLGLQIFGAIFVLYQIKQASDSFKQTAESFHQTSEFFRENVTSSSYRLVLDYDKLFLDKPYLYPYFYKDSIISPSDKNYQEALIVSECIADNFDTFLEERTASKVPISNNWKNWMRDVFAKSPVLRQFMDSHLSWYDGDYLEKEVYSPWKIKFDSQSKFGSK